MNYVEHAWSDFCSLIEGAEISWSELLLAPSNEQADLYAAACDDFTYATEWLANAAVETEPVCDGADSYENDDGLSVHYPTYKQVVVYQDQSLFPLLAEMQRCCKFLQSHSHDFLSHFEMMQGIFSRSWLKRHEVVHGLIDQAIWAEMWDPYE